MPVRVSSLLIVNPKDVQQCGPLAAVTTDLRRPLTFTGLILGTAAAQTLAARSKVRAKLAIMMISVGINMIAPFMTRNLVQYEPIWNE
jgi:hypothetical protein